MRQESRSAFMLAPIVLPAIGARPACAAMRRGVQG